MSSYSIDLNDEDPLQTLREGHGHDSTALTFYHPNRWALEVAMIKEDLRKSPNTAMLIVIITSAVLTALLCVAYFNFPVFTDKRPARRR